MTSEILIFIPPPPSQKKLCVLSYKPNTPLPPHPHVLVTKIDRKTALYKKEQAKLVTIEAIDWL